MKRYKIIGTNFLDDFSVEKSTEKSALRPFGSFTPPKPAMANLTEAFKYEDLAKWLEDRWPVDVEEKLNGFRVIAQKLGDKIRISTEGNVDRTEQFAGLTEVFSKIDHDFILDMSVGIERKGRPLPRIQLMTLMSDVPILEEGDVIHATCFDLPYMDEDLHEKPLSERRPKLESFFRDFLDSKSFSLTSFNVVRDKEGLEKQFKRLSEFPQSGGVVIKTMNSIWSTSGSESNWAKIKLETEIKVIVLEVLETKKGNYRYRSGLIASGEEYNNIVEVDGHKYVDLGKTFSTSLMANKGQILTVGVEEIIIKGKSDKELQWLGPRVIDVDKDRSEPYTAEQVVEIAGRSNTLQKKEGNIDYKVDDTGRGVIQIHFMGIEENEVAALKRVSSEAKGASLTKLRMLLVGAVGQKGAHLDVRLERKGDKYFEGGELMIGNFSGLSKVNGFLEGEKMRFGWKVPHAEEPQVDTTKGPMEWMNAGSNGIEIFEPGKPGGSANKYGAILKLDSFGWKLIQADEHAKKLEITGSKLLGDRIMLIAYVPVNNNERIWMASLLKKVVEKCMIVIPIRKGDSEHIVCGVVYEPDEVDSQGDTATAEEICKGCYYFMEQGRVIKLNHKGSPIDAVILENYITPQNVVIEGRPIKKGSWVMTIKVNDDKIWKGIVDGDYQGFSLAGYSGGELLY